LSRGIKKEKNIVWETVGNFFQEGCLLKKPFNPPPPHPPAKNREKL